MPSAVVPREEDARRPDFDEAEQEFLRELGAPLNETIEQDNAPLKDIDEEVKVTRKRKQTQKLDDTLLLSERGIPKLRRISKDRLRFKGKGHEFSDISRLLNTYQLWLDDLYPKAKFKDALAMVEKLGHSRRMQVSRRAWIDSSKPHRAQEDEERVEDVEVRTNLTADAQSADAEDQGNVPDARQDHSGRARGLPEADESDALLDGLEQRNHTNPSQNQPQPRRGPFEADDEPGEDDLDALLAEEETRQQRFEEDRGARKPRPLFEEEPDEDDLDALLAEETAAHGQPVGFGLEAPFEKVCGKANSTD